MYDEIIDAIEQGNYSEALKHAKQYPQDKIDDTYAVLVATICMHFGEFEYAFDYIRNGLQYNYKNYELYLILGTYYASTNPVQAKLCYENALYYCDSEDDRNIIESYLNAPDIRSVQISPTSIVILSYNQPDLTQSA
ncbi:MAG: hypothetical protein E7294_09200 [Lachnospiraceae bacterium]|nr:hypothetical protein [Lachnospiraceae bacterium]